jgi:hypothetical protein
MILEKQKEALVLTSRKSTESIGMSLDLDSAQILMQMLSKNLYSDPVGSAIRETASNALDSHRRASVTKPIIVSFTTNDTYNYEFSVEDFGTGLDADDVKNIISKYGKSTKREEAGSLGMMGLGFKAPLAYCTSFYFIARKNGVERKYMMYEGETENTIDLLFEKTTKEPNGVKIIIPVESKDKYDFEIKIKQQLAYFEGVYFNCKFIDNNFSIFRSEDFQFSELCTDPNMHICLDNVYYPIDFSKLKIAPINVPVGLKFNLSDGMYPVPSREALRYTPGTIETILKKITVVADYFMTKYNVSICDSDDINAIMDFYSQNKKNVELKGKIISVKDFLKYSNIKQKEPKLKGIKHVSIKSLSYNKSSILYDYPARFVLTEGSFRNTDSRSWIRTVDPTQVDKTNFYIYSGTISGQMKNYLRGTLPKNKKHYFVKQTNTLKLLPKKTKRDESYYEILRLDQVPRELWRETIKEFQYIQNLFISKMVPLDTVVIPESWINSQKKAKIVNKNVTGRGPKLKGDIIGKIAVPLLREVTGKTCKFVSHTIKGEKIDFQAFLTIYTSHEEANLLDNLFLPFAKQKLQLMTFSDRELKNIEKENFHNMISYKTFMKGKSKVFKRVVTAQAIHDFAMENSSIYNKHFTFSTINTRLFNNFDELASYRNKNIGNNTVASMDFIRNKMMPSFEDFQAFDTTIYDVYLETKSVINKLYFLPKLFYHLNSNMEIENNDLYSILIDMFKYHGFRMNYLNYKLKGSPIKN